MNIRSELKSQNGSALIQMVLGSSILGLLIMIISGIVSNSQNEQLFLMHKAAREELRENITSILQAHQYCACSFSNVMIDPSSLRAAGTITELSIQSADCSRTEYTLARVGERIHGLRLNSISVENITTSGTNYSGDLVIVSSNPNLSASFTTRDVLPFLFTTRQKNGNLVIDSCSTAVMTPSTFVPINAGSIYLKQSGNVPVSYVFDELVGGGRQIVLAKLDLIDGNNFTLRIFDPANASAPQTIQVSTGTDGHVENDSSLIQIPVVNGRFSVAFDCNTPSRNIDPGGRAAGECTNIWRPERPYSRNRITPKAILQLIQ